MQLKMTRDHKLMAYVLSRKFHYTMTSIGTLMGVSQGTISTAIKEVEYWQTINNLEAELNRTQQMLIDQGVQPQITTELNW